MGNIDWLVHRVSPLVEPLNDAFGHALLRLDQMGIPTGDDKQWLRTACVRSEVFDYLAGQSIDGWLLDRRSHKMNGAVHLAHSDGDLALKVLREVPLLGGVPCAGSNARRRAFFRNPPLDQLALWGTPQHVSHNVLTLWEERDKEISLRVVRPIGTGGSLRGAPIDMSVDLPRTRTDFESTKFVIYDEDLDEGIANYEEDEDSGGTS